MNNILVRSITGAIFISLILIPLFWSEILATVVLGIFMLVGLIEFYRLFDKSTQIEISWEIGTFFGILIFGISICIMFNVLPNVILIAVFPILFCLFIIELWRKKKHPLLNVAVKTLGIIYVVIPFLLMILLNRIDNDVLDNDRIPLLAGMFLLIWMNDTFAYLSGKIFGKTKLFERVSPNKTWEGAIGGIVFTLLGGLTVGFLFDPAHQSFWVISSLIIAPCAVCGDLLESLFKRSVDVKDSGNIIPGHGGVLDRFDATLFTIPFFIAWTYFYTYF